MRTIVDAPDGHRVCGAHRASNGRLSLETSGGRKPPAQAAASLQQKYKRRAAYDEQWGKNNIL